MPRLRRSSEAEVTSPSLHDREIHPLTCGLIFFVSLRVSNNYLQHIIARGQICAQLNRAATYKPLHIRLAVDSHRVLMAGEHRFAVMKKNYLRHQLRRARFFRMGVVDVKAIAQKHAGVKMPHGGACFRVALVDAFLIGGRTVRVRGLGICRVR